MRVGAAQVPAGLPPVRPGRGAAAGRAHLQGEVRRRQVPLRQPPQGPQRAASPGPDEAAAARGVEEGGLNSHREPRAALSVVWVRGGVCVHSSR